MAKFRNRIGFFPNNHIRHCPMKSPTLVASCVAFSILGFTHPLHADLRVKQSIGDVDYHVLKTTAAAVRIVWKNDEGAVLRNIPAAARYLEASGLKVDTVMNGGIFEPGGIPSGLLIQNGKVMNPVNRKKGDGNFYLLPNGVFYIGSKSAGVISTDEYPPKDVVVREAVQSGPLLLRKGKVHPAFNAASTSRLTRNGVGVTTDGDVVFVMTDFHSVKLPNLHEFAMVFRTLGCDDALFLDGDLSQMRSGKDLLKPSNEFGSLIAVVVNPPGKPSPSVSK